MLKITRRELAAAALAPVAAGTVSRSRISAATSGPGANHFPNVRLRTHDERDVRFYDDLMKGKTVLLSFMYATCEGICPATVLNLRKVQERFGSRMGRDIFLYSITINPQQDTPAVLREYAQMHGAGPGWLFLTGDSADIELLRRKLGFIDRDPVAARDSTSHIGMLLYGNEPLNRWAACPALGNPDQIYRSVMWLGGGTPGVDKIDSAAAIKSDGR